MTCANLAELVRIEAQTLTGGLSTLGTTGSQSGGGLFVDAAPVACRASSPLLENCVIAINDGLVRGGPLFFRNGSNPRVVGCTMVGIEANIAADPRFCDRENSEFTLAADSPCLPTNNDCDVPMGALGQGCALPTGADDDADGALPSVTRLVQNRSNPFNPQTVNAFELAREGAVTLDVYDTRGRRESRRHGFIGHNRFWQRTWPLVDETDVDAPREIRDGVGLDELLPERPEP